MLNGLNHQIMDTGEKDRGFGRELYDDLLTDIRGADQGGYDIASDFSFHFALGLLEKFHKKGSIC